MARDEKNRRNVQMALAIIEPLQHLKNEENRNNNNWLRLVRSLRSRVEKSLKQRFVGG